MTMKTAMARAEGMGQLFLSVAVVDAPYSDPEFLLGGVTFPSSNSPLGAPVSPVVLSWGTFQSGASSDISDEGGGSITLDANAWLTDSGSTYRSSVSSWLAQTNWREAQAILYQWNATEGTPEVVWRGYVLGVTGSGFRSGVYAVELMLSATLRDMEQKNISDLITKADFSTSPIASLNKMVPRAYGRADNILSTTDVGGGLARVGFPMPGIRGVVIGENEATAKVKVRFSNNDGVSAWHTFPTGTSDDAGSYGGLWVYDSGMGCYGMVDNASYSVTNGTGYTEVVVNTTPKVFFFIPLKQIGSTNAAGFTDSNKIIDSDPNNYVTSDAGGNHSWAFYLPSVNFGGRVKSVGVIADWYNAHATKNRQITIGIWDIYGFAGAAWLGGGARLKSITKVPGDPRIISMGDTAAYRYEQSSFGGGGAGGHAGSATRAEFSSGTFVTRNAADALEATLEMRVFVEDLGGANAGRESVRLYNVGIVVEVDYAAQVRPPNFIPPPGNYSIEELDRLRWQMKQEYQSILPRDAFAGGLAAKDRVVGTDFFARGAAQKDDGSGTYTGSAAAVIERVHDISHHILDAVCGETVNVTAGTLGNFVDPRTNGVLKDLKVRSPFGPDVVKRKAALGRLTSRFPLSIRRSSSGAFHCIPDDLNPHSSAVYRSTADPIWIEPNDIERDSFSDRELDISEIVNSIQLNYSHGYPDREPLSVTTYENHLSQKWFTKKTTEPFDYPELQQDDASAAVNQKATDLAQWLGRRAARPRRIVTCKLYQKFYDLEPGHYLGFKDLEDVGISQQAYRAGLLDYYFNSSAGGTDYADSGAAVLISLTSSTVLIGLSQQTDALRFSIGTAAAYTTVANAWRYSSASGFSNFSGVTNTDGLKSTGLQVVGWTRPNWWEWIKSEQTLGGTTYGPCYWIQFNYSVPVTAGLGSSRFTYANEWFGRYFKVLRADRIPGRSSRDYPYKDVAMMEVM